jgi:methionyl-tRNA formyltransferase
MVTSLRVVYLGTPEFAVPPLEALLASRHTVCGVVTQPDRPRGRGQRVSAAPVKTLALARGLPVYQPDRLRDAEVERTFRSWAPDIGAVAAYGKIIPVSLLQLPRFGMINVHASLLPLYRGAAPVHRAVIDGQAETGVSIMRVEKELDSGAVFATGRRQIDPSDTSDAVERDLARLGAELLVSVIDQIAEGTAREEPQDHTRATYAARLTKEEGRIDWTLPAVGIHNRVRGLYPWPHAYSYLDGKRLILLRTHVGDAPAEGAEPGTVIAASAEGIEVAAGSGRVVIEQLQPEGRRPMAAVDYLAGHTVVPGSRFTAGDEPRRGQPHGE